MIVVPDPVTVPTSKYSTIGFTNGISSIFNNTADADVKSTTDCDTVNDPVIIADPENGNGVVDIPDSCEPSPKYVPNDAVDVILPEMFPGIVIFGVAYMYSDCWINPGVYDDVNAICVS